MRKKTSNNFFTQNGKTLNANVSAKKSVSNIQTYSIENISSLATYEQVESIALHEPTLTDALNTYKKRFSHWFTKSKINFQLTKKLWLSGSLVSFTVVALVFILFPMKVTPEISNKYSIYSSTPLKFGSTTYQIYSKDARAQKINMVFKDYNCPLEGMGEIFVYEADKHNIPWWIVAAISFQESSCGKKTPEPEGIESYNAWGWAVYGDNVQSFDNWARGVETVSEYMYNKFFSKGIIETCDIMKVYTPPSKGSWCEGVNYFGDLIQNYNSDS